VPKTGQTACYSAAGIVGTCPQAGVPGQDGDYQYGAAWPRPRFTDNNNGTITDNLTGLIWLKNANCINTGVNWTGALNGVVELNTAGTMNGNNCGDISNGGSHQTDWRLPNARELESLVHYGYTGPAVSNTAGTGQWTAGDPFSNIQNWFYWSSTSNNSVVGWAWSTLMSGGGIDVRDKSDLSSVWPVRDGQLTGTYLPVINSD